MPWGAIIAPSDLALLVAEAILYLGLMLVLFRFRRTIGIGAFFAALGSLHFLETYLAATLYLPVSGGLALSPGSVVLFAGKLALILLVYIREDAVVARQPIYGLLVGSLIGLAVVQMITLRGPAAATEPRDLGLLAEIGWLMLWSTVLLYLDCLVVVLLYERLARSLGGRHTASIIAALAVVLSLDHAAFFAVLDLTVGVPPEAGWGGWLGKLAAALVFGLAIGFYLHVAEHESPTQPRRRFRDLFDLLTYRQRYEALQASERRDPLTGTLHRGELETVFSEMLRDARRYRQPFALVILDLDRFKQVNDNLGHQAGDRALAAIAAAVSGAVRSIDHVVRYGGDEFIVLARRSGPAEAEVLAARIAAAVAALPPDAGFGLTAAVGGACYPTDGITLEALFAAADHRLYASKRMRSGDPVE